MTVGSSESPTVWLARIAPQSAAAWHALGGRAFPGETSLETSNGLYRFMNGVFVSRARRPHRSFDAPKEMRGMRLIGFLADEGGFWSLSPRFRPGAHAVLWKPSVDADGTDPKSFVLTSPLVSLAAEEPEPQPWTTPRRGMSRSGVQARIARPPSFREPDPPSMTRLFPPR
jgi:hypothetical protein